MKVCAISDVGLRRQENQDTFAFEAFDAPDSIVAVVCDGMGGVNGGRLASAVAVSTFMQELRTQAREGMTTEQKREMASFCVSKANTAVYERSLEDAAYRGMGTTLVSAIVSAGVAVVCNVGDSRAYHIGSGEIARVTRDHSVVENLIEAGDITPEEARTHPNRNLITRALGPERAIRCDTYEVALAEGDWLLLCSDGLVVTVTDDEMLEVALSEDDCEKVLDRLLALSKERGAPDNVTAVLIRNA